MKKISKKIFILLFLILFIFLSYELIDSNILTKNNNKELSLLLKQTKSEKLSGIKIEVEVLNGCGEKGVAILYTNFLRSHGYDVISYKNASNFNYDKTIIKVHKIDESNFIDEIADILDLNINQIQYDYNNNIFYTMTIVVGKDYKDLSSYNEVSMHYNPF